MIVVMPYVCESPKLRIGKSHRLDLYLSPKNLIIVLDKVLKIFSMQTEQQAKEREEAKHLLERERLHLSEMEMERNEIEEAKEKLLTNFTDLQQTYENVSTAKCVIYGHCFGRPPAF